MSTTTDAPLFGRSRRSSQPNLATGSTPLVRLAEAAADTVTSTEAVAISRGFDRNSRQRASSLRELLSEQGVTAVEVTPASASERLLAGTEVSAVINLVGAASWQPCRLAAKLRAALLAPSEDGQASESRWDVIGVTGEDGHRDVALRRVAVLPEDFDNSSITISRDDEPLSLPGGQVTVTPHEQLLHVHLQAPDFAAQTFTADTITVEALGAAHRLIRDELPIAELEGALTFSAEPQGLLLRAV